MLFFYVRKFGSARVALRGGGGIYSHSGVNSTATVVQDVCIGYNYQVCDFACYHMSACTFFIASDAVCDWLKLKFILLKRVVIGSHVFLRHSRNDPRIHLTV